MKTPVKYSRNLKERIITKEMLVDCLYSSNKRAKNYRDKENEYRNYYHLNGYVYDKYDNVGQCNRKKKEYYSQKETLLSLLKPNCIHKEFVGYERIRIYSYEKRYKENRNNFVWENCFYDSDIDCEIWFGDIEDKSKPKYRYYLFYELKGSGGFHSPIREDQISNYNLDIINIDQLETEGHEIKDLISNQFVKKVVSLINSGEYKLVIGDAALS